MCKGNKPLLNEDIFRLSPSQQSEIQPDDDHDLNLPIENKSLTIACGSSLPSSDTKWACPACTYLNWPRASRCVQCYTKLDGLKPDLNVNNVNDKINSLSIYGSDPELVIGSNNKQKNNSPYNSARNLANMKSGAAIDATNRLSPLNNETHASAAVIPGKWSCVTCTYENWPKSIKCSMCGTSKEGKEITQSFSENQQRITMSPKSPDRDSYDENCATNVVHRTNKRNNSSYRYQLTTSDTGLNSGGSQERRIRHLKKQVDSRWLTACIGVVENNIGAVEAYLSCGGNPSRSLTNSEVAILNRNSAFDVGQTLIHLAIRFHREEMLPMLLEQISGSGPGIKRVPSYVAPDLASDIRRHFAASLRIRKPPFSCHYVNEHATFALPAEIEELPLSVQEQLYEELLDRDAQKQLESPPPALNWSLEITARLGSRLMVLWNRSAGDCLLDSAMQATWGVFDRDNILRRALSDSLHEAGHIFYPRWKEYEMLQAALMQFTLEETQWEEDWSTLLSLASQPGSSLEQLHIFALAHILRRPIIVYGVKYVKSFRGEDIGYAKFEGIYLPLLWEQSFCIRSPIALGYTRGHFSALVPTECYSRIDSARDDSRDVTFLPLMDCEQKLLPMHFITQSEMGREEALMRQWLDVCMTEGGTLVAQQKLHKRPLLVAQMLEEWLNHYRTIAQVISAPFARRPQLTGCSSDGDSDEE